MNPNLKLNKNELSTCKWYKGHIINNLNLSDKNIENELKNLSIEHWKYSSVQRHHLFQTMSLNMFMDTTNTIIAVFKIKDITEDDREVIYNISYINLNPKKNNDYYFDKIGLPKSLPDSIEYSNLYINNICPVGSTISKDGEYRPVLLYWKMTRFLIAQRKELTDMFKDIYDYFTDKFQDRKLLIYPHYYFPVDDMRKKYTFELELLLNNRKLEFFSISWFIFYYIHHIGTLSDNLNQLYQKIMLKYKHEDIPFFKSLVNKYSIQIIHEMYHLLNTNIRSTLDRGIEHFCKSKLGQKLIPISLREILFPFDITYKPWKEYFVNLKLSDLVVNNISPGFAITTNWIFIKNTDQHLFDNPSQYTRMEKSANAIQISDMLTQARYLASKQVKPSKVLLYDEDSLFELKLHKKSRRMFTSWLSKEFQILQDGIDDDIKHAQLNIIMSNVTFCMFTEFVGRSLYESMFITKNSEFYRMLISDLFSEKGFNHFERFIFEISYNLHCISSKYGIIHGDLHLHNITLNNLFYQKNINIEIDEPKVLYILDNEQEYVFDTNFYYMTIIDFSRSIINPNKINLFKHDTLHKTFDLVDNMKTFEEQQKKYLLNYLYSCKPEYKELGLPFQNSIWTSFDAYFKIFTIIDLYMVMQRFLDFLQAKNIHSIKPYSESINLVKRIFTECDLYLTEILQQNITSETNIEWPIYNVIKKIFSHKLLSKNDISPKKIIDIYNYNNEIKYSLNSINKFPESFFDLEKNKDNDKFVKNSIKRKKIYDEQSLQNYKMLLTIKKRQSEKNIF
jgi:hypothetical protein